MGGDRFSFGLASAEDVGQIMAIERGPGYEALVGRWERDQHQAEMAKPSVRYFALREGDLLAGFAIVQKLGDPDRRAHLKRIAVAEPGGGVGARLLRGLIDWLFTNTDINRLDLDVHVDNDRAARAYEKAGFSTEGVLREYHRAPDGSFGDMRLMALLRREWQERAGGAPLDP